jgi:hypothetical protein
MEATYAMFKSMTSVYIAIKLGCAIGTFAMAFVLLYMPPADLINILDSGCSTVMSCSLEALARVMDGRLK